MNIYIYIHIYIYVRRLEPKPSPHLPPLWGGQMGATRFMTCEQMSATPVTAGFLRGLLQHRVSAPPINKKCMIKQTKTIIFGSGFCAGYCCC